MTAVEIKSKFTCRGILEAKGIEVLDGSKNDRCRCPFHKDNKPSLEISNSGPDVWICRAGCGGGDVVSLLAKFADKTDTEWLKTDAKNFGDPPHGSVNGVRDALRMKREQSCRGTDSEDPFSDIKKESKSSGIVEEYSYTDADGKELYQAVRMEPKDFRQRHSVNGKWIWNMDGVERVLYRLPAVLKAQEIWIVEGEKDANQLNHIGLTATTNVGGAGKWLESYGDVLRDKDVILCGDNDEPGKKHVEKIKEALSHHVKSLRIIVVPKPAKDISDHLVGMSDSEALAEIDRLKNIHEPLYQGETLPVYFVAETETAYSERLNRDSSRFLKLGRWLPSLSEMELGPGDVLTILAETGVGKTAIATNIALSQAHLKTLFFQQELTKEKMFERYVQTLLKRTRKEVRATYNAGGQEPWRAEEITKNILICEETALNLERIDSISRRSELKFGLPPDLIIVDYIQLLRQYPKTSRYEMFSELAEGLRQLAKRRNAVVCMISQVNRDKERSYKNMSVNDAKESGSIENSSSIMLGASRNPDKKTEMCIQVLKANDYGAGQEIICNYDVETLRITEQPKIY